MANRPAPFKQADVKRAVAGVIAAGLMVREVEITPEGRLRVVVAGEGDSPPRGYSFWDKVTE